MVSRDEGDDNTGSAPNNGVVSMSMVTSGIVETAGLVSELRDDMGVDWVSEETPDLVIPSPYLVLYMHLRIFAYTSNTLIVSFE